MVKPHSVEIVNLSQRAVKAPGQSSSGQLVALLGVAQSGAITARVRRLDHRHRRLKGKVQDRLRRQFDLLALGCGLHTAAHASASRGANRRALAASGDGADNASNDRAAANFLRGVLAPRTALFFVLVSLNVVSPAAHCDAIELQDQYRLSGKLACALEVNDVTSHVAARGYNLFSVDA